MNGPSVHEGLVQEGQAQRARRPHSLIVGACAGKRCRGGFATLPDEFCWGVRPGAGEGNGESVRVLTIARYKIPAASTGEMLPAAVGPHRAPVGCRGEGGIGWPGALVSDEDRGRHRGGPDRGADAANGLHPRRVPRATVAQAGKGEGAEFHAQEQGPAAGCRAGIRGRRGYPASDRYRPRVRPRDARGAGGARAQGMTIQKSSRPRLEAPLQGNRTAPDSPHH